MDQFGKTQLYPCSCWYIELKLDCTGKILAEVIHEAVTLLPLLDWRDPLFYPDRWYHCSLQRIAIDNLGLNCVYEVKSRSGNLKPCIIAFAVEYAVLPQGPFAYLPCFVGTDKPDRSILQFEEYLYVATGFSKSIEGYMPSISKYKSDALLVSILIDKRAYVVHGVEYSFLVVCLGRGKDLITHPQAIEVEIVQSSTAHQGSCASQLLFFERKYLRTVDTRVMEGFVFRGFLVWSLAFPGTLVIERRIGMGYPASNQGFSLECCCFKVCPV